MGNWQQATPRLRSGLIWQQQQAMSIGQLNSIDWLRIVSSDGTMESII